MSFRRTAAYLSDLLILAAFGVCLWLLRDRFGAVYGFLFAAAWISAALLLVAFEWSCFRSRHLSKAPMACASTLVLLSDTQKAVKLWTLTGKITMLVGRGADETQDGIDLADTEYATLIDEQHAALNYTPPGWTIEDLNSKNGTVIQRAGEEHGQPLAPGVPYLIRPGDVLCIAGDTRIAVK